jgi:hypothetical protein
MVAAVIVVGAWPRSCCCSAPTQAERPFRRHARVGAVRRLGRSAVRLGWTRPHHDLLLFERSGPLGRGNCGRVPRSGPVGWPFGHGYVAACARSGELLGGDRIRRFRADPGTSWVVPPWDSDRASPSGTSRRDPGQVGLPARARLGRRSRSSSYAAVVRRPGNWLRWLAPATQWPMSSRAAIPTQNQSHPTNPRPGV